MYRSYEDPGKVAEMLEEARANYERELERGRSAEDLVDELIWIQELEDRLNFAWQDEEYDAMHAQLEEADDRICAESEILKKLEAEYRESLKMGLLDAVEQEEYASDIAYLRARIYGCDDISED